MSGILELVIFDDGSGLSFLSEGNITTVLHLESVKKQYPDYSEMLMAFIEKRDKSGTKTLLNKMGLVDVNHKYR
ncbi:hypothetical protein [Alteromonas lipolytica]|uniref:Uncharacterized protein n=1 Tax=Alteromonas lipolytica TaxID=1856405 RepID=A0A1E8FDS4_9ALTE|nr:hypothetical protein [Alteromonas lipolytica]OFI34084.1 hypothetical protein BFC17_21290 [Alteromonas lipolytica]GGF65553.1 hypothetical protein GCM10011338_17380 [Alteromonas lipolytica]